jgi:nitric oxide reductase large subunit
LKPGLQEYKAGGQNFLWQLLLGLVLSGWSSLAFSIFVTFYITLVLMSSGGEAFFKIEITLSFFYALTVDCLQR